MSEALHAAVQTPVAFERARAVYRAVNEATERALRRLARRYMRQQQLHLKLFAQVVSFLYLETAGDYLLDRILAGQTAPEILHSMAHYLDTQWTAHVDPESPLFSDLGGEGIPPELVAQAGAWYRTAAQALREAAAELEAVQAAAADNGAMAQRVNAHRAG